MPSPANAWEGEGEGEEEGGLQWLLPVLRRRMLGNPHDRWEATSEELVEEDRKFDFCFQLLSSSRAPE